MADSPDDKTVAEDSASILADAAELPEEPSPEAAAQEEGAPSDEADTRQPIHQGKTTYWGVTVLFILILLAAIAAGAGYYRRDNEILTQATPIVAPSHSGVSLTVGRLNDVDRIIVEQPNRPNWLLVSNNAISATRPALSPDATQIAYLQGDQAPTLTITALYTNTQQTLTAAQIRQAGETVGLTDVTVCRWSDLYWSPDTQRLAFFVCAADQAGSTVLVSRTAALTSPSLITETTVAGDTARQLNWLGSDQIRVDRPAGGSQPATVQTFDAP